MEATTETRPSRREQRGKTGSTPRRADIDSHRRRRIRSQLTIAMTLTMKRGCSMFVTLKRGCSMYVTLKRGCSMLSPYGPYVRDLVT